MLLYVFVLLLFVHGCIHLVGFAKGFNGRVIPLLTDNISKRAGMLWFISSMLFFASTIIVLLHIRLWWLLVLLALIFSESLIIGNWRNARPGSFINLLILLLLLVLVSK
ncbi:MAG TPA: hypothetical protein PLY34_18575 [Ferruginibacter sp.]|nr:hypothetical protein [Ferruginibacter sp.]HPH92841.1 hypothetical protein [Ferruginibacter sp.]